MNNRAVTLFPKDFEVKDTAEISPTDRPGVEKVLAKLERDLCRVLGAGTFYVLVLARDMPDVLEVQAVTNTTAPRAAALMQAAFAGPFASLH